MAAPIRYGEIQEATVNGKVKLMCHITPKVKMAVNRFDGNNEIYIHINSKQKSISLMLSDFEEVCAVYDTLKQKLHLLQEVSFIHIVFIYMQIIYTDNIND